MNLRDWWREEDWINRTFGTAAGILAAIVIVGAIVFYLWLIIGVFIGD